MAEREIEKHYLALVCNYSTQFPFPRRGVIRQSLDEPERLWSVQDTSNTRKFICSPNYEPHLKDQLNMTTFYQILESVHF